jgi:putative glycosyltransferase (TIGR04348 family)
MSWIVIVSPAPPGVVTGNSVTAERWRKILRSLGHQVRVVPKLGRERLDVLIALHATKSAASVKRAASRGNVRIVVALTGTDLYQDLERLRRTWASLELADRIVLLQPLGLRELPPALRRKSVVIRQSVRMPSRRTRSRTSSQAGSPQPRPFHVVVLANLRRVKDPLRAAYAARLLPEDSRVRVIQAGGALEEHWETRARTEMRRNPRYVWKGELAPDRARKLLERADLLVLSSRSEGGANVLSEAIVAGVPVLASDIPGNVGILGGSYPGVFEVGDTKALARLIRRAETDDNFYAGLCRRTVELSGLFDPKKEQKAWRELLERCLRPF